MEAPIALPCYGLAATQAKAQEEARKRDKERLAKALRAREPRTR